jgi:phosphopentomutase
VISGKPIAYTSGDSVFQIAAHEDSFGLERLYDICAIARQLVDAYNIGRVIARPFAGAAGQFTRTGNRRDYSLPPPEPTLLDRFGGTTISIGKIGDIFAHQGTGRIIKANGNAELWQKTLAVAGGADENLVALTNFVDFDTLYGHRRDIAGYAAALEAFDTMLPRFEALLRPGDLAVITADHGCDPTWPGTDHTRENVPVLAFGPGIRAAELGVRESFADIGQTLAGHRHISSDQRALGGGDHRPATALSGQYRADRRCPAAGGICAPARGHARRGAGAGDSCARRGFDRRGARRGRRGFGGAARFRRPGACRQTAWRHRAGA